MSRARPSRAVALGGALVLLAACTSQGGPRTIGDDRTLPPGPSSPAPSSARPSVDRSTRSVPGHTGAPRHTGVPASVAARYDDRGAVGTAAPVYLRAAPARFLHIEVDHVADREPSPSTIAHIRGILERELDKPGGITIDVDDEIPATGDAYSLRDLAALESRWRDERSAGDTATMWLVYLDGRSAEQRGALGVAYRATSAAVFLDRIDDSATALVASRVIERATVTHEIGHLLGLVDLLFESAHPREDPEHPGHSTNEDSVMFWAVDDTAITVLLDGGPPTDFDRFDRADLAAIRGS